MKLQATKEEMRERFRLYGELYILCVAMCDGSDPADIWDFKLEAWELEEEDVLSEDEPLLLEMRSPSDEANAFDGIHFDGNDTLWIDTVDFSLSAIDTPAVSLQKVLDVVQRYAKEIGKEVLP